MESQTIQQQVQCPTCGAIFKDKSGLAGHIRFKHNVVTPRTETRIQAPQNPSVDAELWKKVLEIDAQLKTMNGQKEVMSAAITQAQQNIPNENQVQQQVQVPKIEEKPKEIEPAKVISVNDLETTKTIRKAIINAFRNTKPNKKTLEFSEAKASKMEFKTGSWALIYKEDLLVRMIPFVWQQDKETKNNWAIFSEQDFYGKKKSSFQLKYPLLLLPFHKSKRYVDYYGRGFLIGVDEISQMQIPLHDSDTDEKMEQRLESNVFDSQIMALYRELIAAVVHKWNWRLILMAVTIIGVLLFGLWYLNGHPQFIQGLVRGFGGL